MSDWPPIQEEDLVPTAKLVVATVGVVALVFLCIALVALELGPFERAQTGQPGQAEVVVMPAPVRPEIQPKPLPNTDFFLYDNSAGFGQGYNATKRRGLDDYGWTDRARGLAHVPVERAMELYLRQQKEAP